MTKCVVIMAGGSGTRFWPISRKNKPKQFLKLTDRDKSMIQLTVERAQKLTDLENIFIVTNSNFKDLIDEQLPQLPKENILYEPQAKNTAPCIAYACAKIKSKYDDAVMVTLSSDHLIKNINIFVDTVNNAADFSENNDCLTTIGIIPTAPETGYGYIKFNNEKQTASRFIYNVDEFVEKPDLDTAKRYLASGQYLWNSGMFVWKLSTILNSYETLLPSIYENYNKILNCIKNNNLDENLFEIYSQMQSISIDYGILEHSNNIYTTPGSFGWDDVGTWSSIERINKTDVNNNFFKGDVSAVDTKNSTIYADKKPVATLGIDNIVVVDTEDVLFVCSKERTQDISKIASTFDQEKKKALL